MIRVRASSSVPAAAVAADGAVDASTLKATGPAGKVRSLMAPEVLSESRLLVFWSILLKHCLGAVEEASKDKLSAGAGGNGEASGVSLVKDLDAIIVPLSALNLP